MSYKTFYMKDWKYVLNINNLVRESKILLEYLNTNYNLILKANLLESGTARNVLDIIIKNNYEFNSFYSIIQLYELINKSKKIIDIKKLFDLYIENMNSETFQNILINIINICNTTNEEKLFINNLQNNYFKHKLLNKNDEKNIKILNYINTLNYKLNNEILSHKIQYNIDSTKLDDNFFKIYDCKNKNICLEINHNNYNYISSQIKDSQDRNKLEYLYYHSNNNILKNFSKILILRHQIAKKANYNNFGEFITNKKKSDFDFIADVLRNIIDNFSPKLQNIFDYISKDLNLDQISQADINFWFTSKKKNILFSPMDIIQLFINIAKKIFGLRVSIIEDTKTWDKTVITLSIHNESNKLYGHVYLDLLYRNNKITCPRVLVLNDHCKYQNNIIPSLLTIVAGYKSVTEKILSLNDAVYLFKQFGYIIQHSSHISNCGFYNMDYDFTNVISDLMEYFFWQKNVLIHFCGKEKIDELIFINKMEKIYSLYFSTIDALFDLLIHTSDFFVNLCKDLAKDELNLHRHMNKLYFDLYDKIMNRFQSFKYNKEISNPNIINKLIDEGAANVYNIVFNDIVAYNLFKLLSENNNGVKFRKFVLENPNDYFKNLINNFFSDEKSEYDMFNIDVFIKYLLDETIINNINSKQHKIKEKISKITI